MADETLPPDAYSHSPAHYFIALGDLLRLRLLLSSLPRLSHPSSILTFSDSLLQSRLAEEVSSVIDRRDVPRSESPLHLAVRLLPLSSAIAAVSCLSLSGADPSLPNSSGWTPLHLSLSLRRRPLSRILLRHYRLSAWAKLRRRLPSLLPALRRIPDFRLRISLRLESPLLPFIPRSDDVRLSKRGSDLRADRRRRISFMFLADPATPDLLPIGSLLILDRDRKEIRDAFADDDDDEIALDDSAAAAYRPGVEIGNTRLVPCTNWLRRERMEMVGEWRTRVYEIHNLVFSFKTLLGGTAVDEDEFPELRLDEDSEEGFIVAEIGNAPPRHSCHEGGRGGAAVDGRRRKSVDATMMMNSVTEKIGEGRFVARRSKEKEVVKNLKPMVWLTEDFPLKTEELLPMLDILANKIKVVKQIRELLTTKFPPGTFPVKVAIPIIPTVRMVITFTKFISLQPSEQFFTPLSSPHHLSAHEDEDYKKPERTAHKSWLKWSGSSAAKSFISRSKILSPQVNEHTDLFSIPSDYKWVGIRDKGCNMKASRLGKGKQKENG